MCRFALDRQGQSFEVWARGRARACRGSLPVVQLRKHNRFGCRRPELDLQPATESRKSFLPALDNRVPAVGAN
jgi:hypothetical protein